MENYKSIKIINIKSTEFYTGWMQNKKESTKKNVNEICTENGKHFFYQLIFKPES